MARSAILLPHTSHQHRRMTRCMRSLQEVAASRLGYVSAWEAREHGVSRMAVTRAIRDGTLVRVARVVYRFGAAPQHAHEAIIAGWLTTAHAPAIVSHWSALVLAGVIRSHPAVHLLVPRLARGWPVPSSAVMHTSLQTPAAGELTGYHGVLATTVTRSLLDIARVCRYEEFTPLARVAIAEGFLLIPPLRRAACERGGKAERFLHRFLRSRYRDYIREASRGRARYAERIAGQEARSEICHDLAW